MPASVSMMGILSGAAPLMVDVRRTDGTPVMSGHDSMSNEQADRKCRACAVYQLIADRVSGGSRTQCVTS